MQRYLLILLVSLFSCHSKTNNNTDARPETSTNNGTNTPIGGPCEGCEAIFEYKQENKILSPVDTLPAFDENAPKLKITGTVYHIDKKTPAENIILYVYQTNKDGLYKPLEKAKGWARKHGFIRGWVKTGKDGKYTFYTFRPAAYPNRAEPEHIHITVKEPNKNEYYLDSYHFQDDTLLTKAKIAALENRGGSGICQPQMEDGIRTIKRDLYLGLNIPNYN